MYFSPLLIVATATFLSSSATASPFLLTRQAETNTSSAEITDPHASPPIPDNYAFGPIADGGVGWAEAFKKAQSVVSQMTIEERVNIVGSFYILESLLSNRTAS
jgi:hypothetical protein